LIQYFNHTENQVVETDKVTEGAWVNILPPLKQEEFKNLAEELDIPLDFLTDSLDIDERSRFEAEDDVKLIVLKAPTENNSFNDSDAYYITIPICIILTPHQIVTVNSFENTAIKRFLNTFKNRSADHKNMMALKIFEKVVQTYLGFLKEINQKRNLVEKALYDSNRNEQLLQMMRIQKSLVYLVTALRSNELLFLKLQRTNFLNLNEDELGFLEDLIVDNSQALETANVYTNILSSTLDAFASIIANNQNDVLRRLAIITIMLNVPVLIASIWGMNVDVPGKDTRWAFYVPIGISLLISVAIAWFYLKQNNFFKRGKNI
jgi:magnesium transporter